MPTRVREWAISWKTWWATWCKQYVTFARVACVVLLVITTDVSGGRIGEDGRSCVRLGLASDFMTVVLKSQCWCDISIIRRLECLVNTAYWFITASVKPSAISAFDIAPARRQKPPSPSWRFCHSPNAHKRSFSPINGRFRAWTVVFRP